MSSKMEKIRISTWSAAVFAVFSSDVMKDYLSNFISGDLNIFLTKVLLFGIVVFLSMYIEKDNGFLCGKNAHLHPPYGCMKNNDPRMK